MEETLSRKITQDNFVTEKVDIFKNNLLGEYNEDGYYSIAPQIVEELIELKKVRKNSYDNSVFCFGNLLGYGEIDFEVSFEKTTNDQNLAKASLYVLEDVDKVNGYLQNIIKTKLADFSSDIGNFIEHAYAKFNVIDENIDAGREKKSLDDIDLGDSYILAKKAYMLMLDKLSGEKLLDAYGKYFTARLTILTQKNNEFSEAVLDSFNSRYELIEDVFLKEKNYKALNELLDACIESVAGTKQIFVDQEIDFNNSIKENLDEFTSNINKLSDNVEQKAINMLDKEDRNKMEEMNDSFEKEEPQNVASGDLKNEIDESFQNPLKDLDDVYDKSKQDGLNSDNQLDEIINDEISKMENENTLKDDLIEHISSMQNDGEENQSEEQTEEQEEEFELDKNLEEQPIENEISQEFIGSRADFHKSRQNDRLSNITERLSKLSEDSNQVSQENSGGNDVSSSTKDKFSAVFDYLEKKKDDNDMTM